MTKIILGLAGEIASGKGTIASYIVKKYQGSTPRFSTMLRDVLDRLYIEQSRENMQKLSTMLRQGYGEDALAKVMAKDVQNDSASHIVIDGIRRISDIIYLQKIPEFKLVYIEADMRKRYERIVQRGENTDDTQKTFEEFQKDHSQESETRIKDLKKQADFIIDNNGTPEELYKQVDKIIS